MKNMQSPRINPLSAIILSFILFAIYCFFAINHKIQDETFSQDNVTHTPTTLANEPECSVELNRTSHSRIMATSADYRESQGMIKNYAIIARDIALEDFGKAVDHFANVPKEHLDEYVNGLIIVGTEDHFLELYDFLMEHESSLKNPDYSIQSLLAFASRKNPNNVLELLKSRDKDQNAKEFDRILDGYFGSGIHRDFNKLTESLNLLVDNNDRNRAFQATVRQVGPVELDEFMHNLNASNEYTFINSDSYFVLIERLLRALDSRQAEAIIPIIQDETIKKKAINRIENFKAANNIK